MSFKVGGCRVGGERRERPGQAGQGHRTAHAPQPRPAHTGPRAAAGRLRLQAGGGEGLAGRAGPRRGLGVATR